MGILNNYMQILTLSLLTFFINTSWTAKININNNLVGGILQNNEQNGKTSAAGAVKQVDQRISDIIAENVLHFGHNLGIKMAALDPYASRSEIFSPLSLIAALSMLTLGAKGRSYQELKQILGLDADSEIIHNPNKYHEEFGLMLNDLQHTNVSSGVINKRPIANWQHTKAMKPSIRHSIATESPAEHIIKVTNGLFVQNEYTLNPDYRQVLQSIYKAELTELNFRTRSSEATDYINAWVNKATFGKISKIIYGDLYPSTNIVLASALYFKAIWETKFFESTGEDNFYPDGVNNPPIKVQMMRNAGIFPFYDAKEYDCRIIGLPYKGNETTMYVIQPNDSSRMKLRDLQHVLDAQKINSMIDNMARKTTILLFPKMHFTRRLHMKQILKAMNVHDVFVNGYSDLSLIGNRRHTASIAAQALPESVPVSFESIYRSKPVYQAPVIFTSRFGDSSNSTEGVIKNDAMRSTEKPSVSVGTQSSSKREKRQISNFSSDPASLALWNLESNRQKPNSISSDLYVDEILHNVDFSVDENGTEAAAVTSAILLRSGTEVIFRGDTPFIIVIRHDPTKLPLFYGIINKPEL